MARYVDVTVPLVPGRVPLYPGDTQLEVTRVQSRAQGEDANVSRLVCSLHCGTHVDGPAHFFDGEPGVDVVAVEALIGPAWVVDATSSPAMLDADRLDQLAIPAEASRVLFKTTTPRSGTPRPSWRTSLRSPPMVPLRWSSGASGRSASTSCPSPRTPIQPPPTRCC